MIKNWIFLDRDGTLIIDKHYLHNPDEVEIIPGVISGLIKLKNAGYRFVITTNQSGVGRGYYGINEVNSVNERISYLLDQSGISIEGFFTCPHKPDEGCECRKPETGLAIQAAKVLNFSLSEVGYVIGDKKLDMDFAVKLGAQSVLVMTGYGAEEFAKGVRGFYNVGNIDEAADVILNIGGA